MSTYHIILLLLNSFLFLSQILEMGLNFFLCSLSPVSYHNQKQKKGERHFPLTFFVCAFQFKWRNFFSLSSCFHQVLLHLCVILSTVYLRRKEGKKTTKRYHSIQWVPGDSGTNLPVHIPAGHLLVMQTWASCFTPLASVSALVFGSKSISLIWFLWGLSELTLPKHQYLEHCPIHNP